MLDRESRLLLAFAAVFAVVCLLIVGRQSQMKQVLEREQAMREEAYRYEQYAKALESFQNGEYGWADYYLRNAGYTEKSELRLYAKARILYRKHDAHSIEAYELLEKIPRSYKGDLHDEIKAFRGEAQIHRSEMQKLYDREVERQAEMERREKELQSQRRASSSSKKSSSKKSSSKKSDPYDVYDYTHADDFYYDHWDDFSDFEEAEDYFDEHN